MLLGMTFFRMLPELAMAYVLRRKGLMEILLTNN